MNSIHRVLKSTSVLILLAAISFPQTTLAANRHPAKAQRRGRPKSVRRLPKSARAARHREEARRRAELPAGSHSQTAPRPKKRSEIAFQTMIDKTTLRVKTPRFAASQSTRSAIHAGTVVVMDPKSGRVFCYRQSTMGAARRIQACSTIKTLSRGSPDSTNGD